MSALTLLRAWRVLAPALLLAACGGPLPLPPEAPADAAADALAVGAWPDAAPAGPSARPSPRPSSRPSPRPSPQPAADLLPARGPGTAASPPAHATAAAARTPWPGTAQAPAGRDTPAPEVAVSGTELVVDQATADRPLVVWEFELRAATGEPVPTQAVGGAGIQGAGVAVWADSRLPEGMLQLWPLQPLAPGVAYTAYFTATPLDGSEPVTRSWTVRRDADG